MKAYDYPLIFGKSPEFIEQLQVFWDLCFYRTHMSVCKISSNALSDDEAAQRLFFSGALEGVVKKG
ncbi:MAG: hypothetical protein LBG98_00720 [Puniceicoccales bacterium]|nr:hypothetical protein [Puniceicoccales bacterium]